MEHLHIDDVKLLAMNAHGNEEARRELFAAALEGEGRTSANALWALTHLPKEDSVYLDQHRRELTMVALSAADVSRRRLALALLERLEWTIDVCLLHLMDPSEAVGVRALCGKLAYMLCRHFPELLSELRQSLLMLEPSLLKPGFRHTRNKLLSLISNSL